MGRPRRVVGRRREVSGGGRLGTCIGSGPDDVLLPASNLLRTPIRQLQPLTRSTRHTRLGHLPGWTAA